MDRPIIFSAPMVRALLDGRKTQTRRVLKPQPSACRWKDYVLEQHRDGVYRAVKTPYAPGDRLWVREAWATVNTSGGPGWAYRADGDFIQPEYDGEDFGVGPSFNYDKYPGKYSMWFDDLLAGVPGHQWKSSIHMPRWASRLTLTVTDVRVQRLQDISDDDVRAEGIGALPGNHTGDPALMRADFRAIWNSIHGPGAWEANPWVAAISFTVERGNIDALREAA